MKKIYLSDVTIRQYSENTGADLTFREKLEAARLLDRLEVNAIELPAIRSKKADTLLIKTVAQSLEHSALAVDAAPDEESVKEAWEAVKSAKYPKLRIVAALSASRMEYIYHKKADAMQACVKAAVAQAKALCDDVEFEAEDACRADTAFLVSVLKDAIDAGAGTVTITDSTGSMLPDEFGEFIDNLYAELPELKNVRLGVSLNDEMRLADACAAKAILKGAEEIKVSALSLNTASLEAVTKILKAKSDVYDVATDVLTTEIRRVVGEIEALCSGAKEHSVLADGVREYDKTMAFTASDSMEDVIKAVESLGYEMSESDKMRVWEAFKRAAGRKESIDALELDAIAAGETMQSPEAYKLENYMVTTGNELDTTAHIKLSRDGEIFHGLSVGDGPIDAAFLAIENITGRHYELDDFQIRSISQGREAMGETIVKLRYDGKLYAGRGLSTDIVGSGIEAYISALNKITAEEENG